MPYRFATEEIENKVTELASAIASYQNFLPNIVKTLAGYIEVYSPDSGLEIRYITSEGRDDERWRGALLSASKDNLKVDCWCITITLSEGKDLSDLEPNSFDKPFGLGIDYFYDYDYGTDLVNSESYFNKQVDGFEYILEQIRTCLPDGVTIESYLTRRMIKKFTNASTHIAKIDLALEATGL